MTGILFGHKLGLGLAAPKTGGGVVGVALSLIVNKSKTTGAYTFTAVRSGDVSAARNVNFAVAGSTLNGAEPAQSADFGGTFPTGVIAFSAGQSSKTFSVTPSILISTE